MPVDEQLEQEFLQAANRLLALPRPSVRRRVLTDFVNEMLRRGEVAIEYKVS